MLKNTILCVIVVFSIFGYSQSENKNLKSKIESFSIALSVDSAEDVEEALSSENIESFFEIMDDDEDITFKLKCNFSEGKDKMTGNMTYAFTGKGKEKEKLLKDLKKAKSIALKFYNFKNKNS